MSAGKSGPALFKLSKVSKSAAVSGENFRTPRTAWRSTALGSAPSRWSNLITSVPWEVMNVILRKSLRGTNTSNLHSATGSLAMRWSAAVRTWSLKISNGLGRVRARPAKSCSHPAGAGA